MILVLTGHREEKFAHDVRRIRESVRESLIEAKPDVVVCGMANGFDLHAGHEACNLGIDVWAVRPWAGHKPRKEDKHLYEAVMMFAEKEVVVNPSEAYPGPWVYQARNEWMVDHGTHILAYWDHEEKGGTWNCIKYAKSLAPVKILPIRNVFDRIPPHAK